MTSFIVKKWIGALLAPLPLITLLFTIAVILNLFASKEHKGRGILLTSWLCLLAFTTPFLPNHWIAQFENHYPPYHFEKSHVDEVIVLGCKHSEAEQQPITSQISHCSMARLNEGIRIIRHYPQARLVLSGGKIGQQSSSNAEKVAELAIALGVDESRILTEPGAKDTAEEASLLAPRLKGRQLVLVTSASHMPRAMKLFNQAGLNPTPAPTQFLSRQTSHALPVIAWLPHSAHLEKTQRAFYETMGIAWVTLVSWFR